MEKETPAVAVDIILFTILDHDLKVLLVKRKYPPFKGVWAIPGGFVRPDEPLEQAATRELLEETNVKDVYLEQLYTFGDPKRDPRKRVISVSYFALVNADNFRLKASGDTTDVRWFSMYALPSLGFDHKTILDYALLRLRYKLEYTTVAFSLLPKRFTLTQLQDAYEIIFHREFDKRNFRKKILSLGLLKETPDIQKAVKHRPAKLYMPAKKVGEIIEII